MTKEVNDAVKIIQIFLFEEKRKNTFPAKNALQCLKDQIILHEDAITLQEDKISDLKNELEGVQDELDRLKETHGLN